MERWTDDLNVLSEASFPLGRKGNEGKKRELKRGIGSGRTADWPRNAAIMLRIARNILPALRVR